ncbi:hypothetical protein PSTAB_2781 [Stutzerimonas stutzeri]|uniref:Uncharacterized protein n=1 Tax=Stutzerimonas stutzeri (strain ATCC 17588 / DSM 5190 / CCUG 11256 / JCM 5965 / LMG 11199 / NBRC 14165 / NCIMB 11358 / Stanier 221) TaxID=96563 RepID=F8H5P5_STUS2|nr:HPP family protein [Stutzerimonas stutzeri]AEJ06062.1 hypothetical protein PSTAB_2781 [Stutzerimonas stutzeri]
MTISTPQLQDCLGASRQRLQQALLLSLLGLLMLLAMQWLPTHSILLAGQQVESRWLYALLPALVLVVGLVAWGGYLFHRRQRRAYAQVLAALNEVLQAQELSAARHALAAALPQARKSPLTRSVLNALQPKLDQHLDELTRQHLYRRLVAEVARTRRQCQQRLEDIKSRIPLIKAETTLRETHNRLQKRREQLSDLWEETYEKFSWWNKMKYSGGPDFSGIDQAINQLNFMHRKLKTQHTEDFARLNAHFSELKSRAEARITASQKQIEQFIAQEVTREQDNELPLKAALWLSALSVPVSLWDDFTTAGNIYDALRSVNGNYAGMSDAEIWLETLFLPAEQLAGLASLTKGAYFEQLVAADTGGTLFEHFNNPGTDIIIDGQAFQLKATASAAYVNSVDADIPVIATSEVAEQTRAIDSGYSNIELENSVDLTLGGSIVDVKDTGVDALLAGVGGLGFFATIQGINHAGERYKNGGDGVEALFEGAGVAIEGTARALVGTAELGYKVLSSRPSRFIGRTLLAGLKKLDDKMMEAGKKPE